jgi:hypothetical protein
MEAQIAALRDHVLQLRSAKPESERLILGIYGIPGAVANRDLQCIPDLPTLKAPARRR